MGKNIRRNPRRMARQRPQQAAPEPTFNIEPTVAQPATEAQESAIDTQKSAPFDALLESFTRSIQTAKSFLEKVIERGERAMNEPDTDEKTDKRVKEATRAASLLQRMFATVQRVAKTLREPSKVDLKAIDAAQDKALRTYQASTAMLNSFAQQMGMPPMHDLVT